jgi:hypothetical protein
MDVLSCPLSGLSRTFDDPDSPDDAEALRLAGIAQREIAVQAISHPSPPSMAYLPGTATPRAERLTP